MDSLTQIVLGAAVGEKVLGKKLGNKALLYGAVAGTIPDLDVLAGKFMDPIDAIAIHRGFSHSVVFFLLISPILGFLISKIEKRKRVSTWEGISLVFWGLLTHVLLDAFTTWGTQIFWPLDYKVAFKSIFVIDPLYTLPFLACLIMVMRYKKTDFKRTVWVNRGLVISTFYLFLSLGVKIAALNRFENSLKEQGIAYQDIIVKPAPFNIILWNANIATSDGYLIADYSFLDSQPIAFQFYPQHKEWLGEAINTPVMQQLIDISEGWYILTKKEDRLFFNDLRFGLLNTDLTRPEFAFSYEIVRENDTVQAYEVKNKTRKEGKELLIRLLRRIRGN